MQGFVDFLVNNYLWFMVISIILIFALIGYLVDTGDTEKTSRKKEKVEEISTEEVPIESPEVMVQEEKTDDIEIL